MFQEARSWSSPFHLRSIPEQGNTNPSPIPQAEKRLRRQLVNELRRKLSLERELPLDAFYTLGHLHRWQWTAGHLFREERMAMLEAKAKGRNPITGKVQRFSMDSLGIERAMRLEWKMSPQYLEIARAMIGEIMVHIELPQVQRVTVWLAEFYGLRPMVDGAWVCGEV